MNISQFDYKLPKELIARKPANPRDSSRLMVVEKASGRIGHTYFNQIAGFLQKGDVLVVNASRVLPARLQGIKIPGRGKAEVLLLNPAVQKQGKIFWTRQWKIVGKPRLKLGQKIKFSSRLWGKIVKDFGLEKVIEFNVKGQELKKIIFSFGKIPLPPYIKLQIAQAKLKKYYQTVYAKKQGSIAAPTAGFHFSRKLIRQLKEWGIVFQEIVLHVGLGTFQSIKTAQVENHQMAPEWARIDKKTADFLNKAKKSGKRLIAVGTTSARTLESFWKDGKIKPGEKMTDIFIYPGYKFKVIDGLITNFHLPKSTPFLMVCAFAGRDLIFRAYQEAIKNKYRFYSFGDAMLII